MSTLDYEVVGSSGIDFLNSSSMSNYANLNNLRFESRLQHSRIHCALKDVVERVAKFAASNREFFVGDSKSEPSILKLFESLNDKIDPSKGNGWQIVGKLARQIGTDFWDGEPSHMVFGTLLYLGGSGLSWYGNSLKDDNFRWNISKFRESFGNDIVSNFVVDDDAKRKFKNVRSDTKEERIHVVSEWLGDLDDYFRELDLVISKNRDVSRTITYWKCSERSGFVGILCTIASPVPVFLVLSFSIHNPKLIHVSKVGYTENLKVMIKELFQDTVQSIPLSFHRDDRINYNGIYSFLMTGNEVIPCKDEVLVNRIDGLNEFISDLSGKSLSDDDMRRSIHNFLTKGPN